MAIKRWDPLTPRVMQRQSQALKSSTPVPDASPGALRRRLWTGYAILSVSRIRRLNDPAQLVSLDGPEPLRAVSSTERQKIII